MTNRLHGGNVWPFIASGEKGIIDFSANISPLALPKELKEFIIKNLDKLAVYPEPFSAKLKKALSMFFNVPEDNLLIGNGSIEFIYLIPSFFRPKKVLLVSPSFSEYEFSAKTSGADLLFVRCREENNFKVDIAQFKKYISKVDLAFLCNPNTPTGTLLKKDELFELIAECKRTGTILVLDEVFMDFVPEGEGITMASEVRKQMGLIVIGSLTKFFALAGLRVGYAICHKAMAKKLRELQYPWNINSMAQIIAREIITDMEYIGKIKETITNEREYLFNNLKKIKKIKVFPSEANFFLCKLLDSNFNNSAKLAARLIEHGIMIRNCANYRGLGDRFFRVAVRKRSENIKLISALKNILRK